MDAATDSRRTPSRPRRRWWWNGTLWIGVLGTALGAAATLGVNEAVATLFPETDRASRLSNAIQELTREMQASRDNVARLASQLRAQEPGSAAAAETARQLETSADALVQKSDSLAAAVTQLSESTPQPPAAPATSASGGVPASPPAVRTTSVAADSAPTPDLWLPTYQSTMIGGSRNSFGVRSWRIDQIAVALNGDGVWMHAGDRLRFPDPEGECYILYLRTVDPDPSSEGGERHGFALTCTPRPESP